MKRSIKIGMGFGITSGIITTLGLMVGLNAGTNSKLAVIGGVLTIAIADAFSDALGIHISEESDKTKTTKEVWESTIATFLAKLIFASTFIIAILFLELPTAIIVNIIWGLSALCVLSYLIAKAEQEKKLKAILEHLSIAILVIIITHLVGDLIHILFYD